MSIISKIPDNSRVRYPVVRFVSDNLNGLGQYNWSVAANLNVQLIADLQPQHVYLFERVSFFANVEEGAWLESMLTPADFPRVALSYLKNVGSSIYGEPFRCVNYVDNNEQLLYTQAKQKGDVLTASMFGLVQQSPGMVGKLNLLAQINFTVYEITDKNWISLFETNPARVGLTLRE